MITANINFDRVDQKYLVKGKNGRYLDLVHFENRNGKDQYGNDGYVVQGIPKEARDRGERGAIIGNWRNLEDRRGSAPAPARPLPPARADGTRY